MKIALHPTRSATVPPRLRIAEFPRVVADLEYEWLPSARLRRPLGGTVHPCPVGEEPGTPLSVPKSIITYHGV